MGLTVADLVQRFDSGEIRLPLMQRDYVWKPKKVVRLLDSLYRDWPIGSFYVWHTNDGHPAKARFGGVLHRRLDSFYGFLLDGQQRLTSLSLAIQGEAEAGLAQRGFFDLENQQFYLGEMKRTITKRIQAGDPLLVPLSEIILLSGGADAGVLKNIERVIEALKERSMLGKGNKNEVAYRERLHRLSNMLQRDVLYEEFSDDHEEDAFELFSRLNRGGTSLSAGDVEAARLSSAATRKIVEPMRAVVAEPKMRALGINFVFLVRTLVTVHRGNCSFSKLPRAWADDTSEVERSWNRTERALRATVEFIRAELGWTTRRWLPSTMALVPVVYLLARSDDATLNAKVASFVERYLLISGLRSLFRGSQETAVNTFVNAIRNVRGDQTARARAILERIPKNRKFKIQKDDIRRTSGMYSPLMQVYLAYLYKKDAKSWPSSRSIRDVLHQELDKDPVAVHHIFPKKFMQDRDVPIESLNTVANYAIISQADNSELGDQNPFDVWRGLKGSQQECASLQLCFIANDKLLRPEAYDEFLDFRAERLAERLNDFLGLGHSKGKPLSQYAVGAGSA